MGVKSNTFRPGESHLNIRVWPAPVSRGIRRVQLVPWKFLSLSLFLSLHIEGTKQSKLLTCLEERWSFRGATVRAEEGGEGGGGKKISKRNFG